VRRQYWISSNSKQDDAEVVIKIRCTVAPHTHYRDSDPIVEDVTCSHADLRNEYRRISEKVDALNHRRTPLELAAAYAAAIDAAS